MNEEKESPSEPPVPAPKQKPVNEQTPAPNLDESKRYLADLVLEYLGIPRPYRSKYMRELEDELLPKFVQMSRHAWNATLPMIPLDDPSIQYLTFLNEQPETEIRQLNDIFGDLGVHEMLADLAASPHVVNLVKMPVDPYEVRLLKTAADPTPDATLQKFLARVAAEPDVLVSSDRTLEKAADAFGRIREDIQALTQPNHPRPASRAGARPAAGTAATTPTKTETSKPKRWKLFNGLGSLASGLVLLAGDSLLIPTVSMGGITGLPIIGSLAGGIAAVGKGIGDLRREGE